MKKLLLIVLVSAICTACTEVYVDEQCNEMSKVIPETIYVSLDDDTRVQLDVSGKTVWTAGDELTAFYRSDANSKFAFRGNTGDRNGGFTIKDQGTKTMDIDEVILIYPYSDSYKLDANRKVVDAKISSVQHYEAGSYGIGSNLMASVETDDNFTLKSLCGWIAVQLKGAGSITRVTLTGNNGEQLAGDVKFNYADFNLELLYYPADPDDDSQVGGSLIFGDYQQTITLECDEGVDLHYTEPTEFYFVVAPQTFAKGITIEAVCSDGTVLTKSSSHALTVERNHIVSMSALTVMESVPNNQIWYTTTDGEVVTPFSASAFGASIQSNTYVNGKGVMCFDGDVTEIGEDAFSECETLLSVTMPNCVTAIGDGAFSYCTSITNINIPENVKSIGECAFESCSSLEICKIPNGVASIGDYTFADCGKLAGVTIPNSVTSIGNFSFWNCISLDSVTIPDKVTSIGNQAFAYCGNLTDVKMGEGVSEIGELAFFNCVKLKDITIPNGISTIAYYTFAGCESLISIIIPNTVTEIDEGAFSGCINLSDITIPDSVTAIGDGAFLACYKLKNVSLGTQLKTIGSYVFSECAITSVTIPDSVTMIGNAAFRYCFELQQFKGKFSTNDGCCLVVDGELIAFAVDCGKTEYIIPDNVVVIGENAFEYCVDLTGVYIANGVTTIESGAFENCYGLKEITIPNSVITIGDSAFSDCSSMKCVTISDSVTTIGNYAFSGCSSVESVTLGKGITTFGNSSFRGCTGTLYVNCNIPDRKSWGSVGPTYTYVDGFYAAEFNEVVICEGVKTIGYWAFEYCNSLQKVSISETVEKIGNSAFWHCENLNSVTISSSVSTIGAYAFGLCYNLTNVYCKPLTPPTAVANYDGYWNSFMENTDLIIYVPTDSVDEYKAASGWSNYTDKIVGYDF